MRPARLRFSVRPQPPEEGISALYISSVDATLPKAEKTLMAALREKDPTLEPIEIIHEYQSSQDAIHLLQTVSRYYEPVQLIRKKPKKDEA